MRTDQEVIDTLCARREGRLVERKIGLLLPGGGMNGVFSGGVMQVLERHGFSNVFDVIYGYSSGAATGAYLLSGNTQEGSSIYSQDLCGLAFFQPWRPYNWMNMEYFEDVIRRKKPLHEQRVKESKTLLKLRVTEIITGKTSFITNRDNIDIFKAISASCAFPGFTPPVELNGKLYCDGGVTEFVTINHMIRDGCTDILAIPTVPVLHRRPIFDPVHVTSRLFLRGYGDGFRKKFSRMKESYNAYLDHLFGDDIPDGINVYVLPPDYHVSPMATNAKKLREYELHGITKAEYMLKLGL